MTSTRGQNVSVLQLHCATEPWDPPITTFTDTGGSLRSAPRLNPLRSDKGIYLNGDKFKQHSQESSLPGTLTKYPKRDFNSSKSINVVITNNVNSSSSSSSGLNSVGRELSPVRWCDREVDGVYLGKSGWVQVQQRSLDENRRVGGDKNGTVSTLSNRIKFSNYHSNSETDERKERHRPAYLPLPKDKRQNHRMPSSLVQEFGSVSPPSITPIISPPPAFKDPGLELEFQSYTSRTNSSGKSPFLSRSKAIVDSESPPKSPPDEWNSISTLSHRFKKLTPSPISNLQQNHLSHMLQTKSLEDDTSKRKDFGRFQDSTLPFSHFGFRSLDSSAGRHPGLRTQKTDSPIEMYDSREEDYRDYVKMNNSSSERLSRERISPNALRQRSHQRNGRRTPGSEFSTLTKYSKRSSSLESSSSSSCERKSPNTSFRRTNSKQNRQQSENAFDWETRNSKVRRSRSLQLTEKRSPNGQMVITPSVPRDTWERKSPDYLQDKSEHVQMYAQSPQTDHRVMVTVNGDSTLEKPRRHSKYMSQLEESKREERLREAKEEARIISDFLNGTRSRAAARNLLMHRYLNRSEDDDSKIRDPPSEPEYGVHFLGTNRRFRKKLQHQNEINYSNETPCNLNNCDFWPYCSNRDPAAYSKPPPPSNSSTSSSRSGNIKSSQSYPNQRKESKGGSTRSSPASLDSMSDFDSKKRGQKMEMSNRMSPSALNQNSFDSRVDRHHFQNSEGKLKKFQKQSSEKMRNRPDTLGGNNFRPKVKQSVSLENNRDKDRKSYVSPYEESSSVSSSSSDIWHNASGTKSSKTQKSSETSSPLEEYNSRGPGKEFKMPQEVFASRPGSAPTEDHVAMNADQRSLSLPKSFLSERYGFRHSAFSWKQQYVGSSEQSPEASQWPLGLEVSKTAPATPVRELGNAKDKESVKKVQCTRSASTPLLEEPLTSNLSWSSPGTTPERPENLSGIVRNNSVPHKKPPTSGRLSGPSESVLQKFKKSLSLKFTKGKGSSKYDSEDSKALTEGMSEEDLTSDTSLVNSIAKEDSDYIDQKFRFSSLGWSSKERKRGKKEFRNGRKNGIQVENRGNIDSSESTDHHDDIDSPPMMRRRAAHSAEKSSRPHSEVLNQILIDKFKADLQWRTQRRYLNGRRIRRTNSDLGDQRLLNRNVRNHFKGLVSTSSLGRPPKVHSVRPNQDSSAIIGSRGPKTQLRRSVSQPLGLNELFTLVSRRPSAMKSHTFSEDDQYPRGGNSEDEIISDSDSSVASLSHRKKSVESGEHEKVVILAEAVWDNVAMEPYELPFRAGDVIEVLDTCDRDWWWGATNEHYGYFPSAFVRLRVSQEDTVEDCLAAMASGRKAPTKLRRGTSISLLSNDQVRSSVVRELINTEQDFVKVLLDVTEGYITECRRRTDMFTPALINTIFSNWEDLLIFQRKFFHDLEGKVNRESPHKSCVGETFLLHSSGFRMYSEYCNSHPMAIATLQELYQRNNYCKFFEACRLMRGLIEIPLDGYLLTPVQRICKYPLQLAELLKYTKPDHPDYDKVSKALEAMRGVATLINERKRKMESLEKLASWQQRVEGWEGEDLIEMSSQLIYQGEVIRITSGMWTSNITLFLFDHQVVYCKKDLLKRNTYVYKGRLCLDTSEVIDLPDGKDQQLGVTVRNGIKIYSCLSDKWLVFCCRSTEEKLKWLDSLAEEKRIVVQDREGGLVLPPAARQLARMAARSKKSPPSKPRGKNYKLDSQYERVDPRTNRSDGTGLKKGRRMGTWFPFGGGMKGRRVNMRSRSSPDHVT